MKKTLVLILGAILLLAVMNTGCVDDEENDDILSVIVTIPPQIEWVERVGGDNVKVTVMVPPGADPHTHEPTVSQMRAVAQADIYFKLGSGIEFEERWMETLLEQNSDMVVVDGGVGIDFLDYDQECDHKHHECDHGLEHLIEDIEHIIHEWEDGDMTAEEAMETIEDLIHDFQHHSHLVNDIDHIVHEWEDGDMTAEEALDAIEDLIHDFEHGHHDAHDHDHHHDHDHEGDDPHTWLSPVNVKIMVNNLLDALVEIDTGNEQYYRNNAQGYLNELDTLHQDIKVALNPYLGRKFLIYHPSMGYFAHEYGLIQVGVEREGREPGVSGLMAVIEQAKEDNIKVVFVSPQFDESNAQTIADEIGGEVIHINPLAEAYLDNLEEISNKLVSAFQEV